MDFKELPNEEMNSENANKITIEADSVEDTRKKATSQLPTGFKISSELIITDGKPVSIQDIGRTAEKAFAKLRKRIPPGAEVISREELQQPGQREMEIVASDMDAAKISAEMEIQDYEDIERIELFEKGSKGFLGIGKKPHLYQVSVSQESKVNMTYKEKAKVHFTVAQKSLIEADTIEEMEVILESGSPIDVRNDGGYTPLMLAALHGDVEIVKFLFSRGSDVNAATSWGATALTRASQDGETATVQLLISSGAAVNASEYDGYTALSRAAMNGHSQIVGMLLSNGADASIRTRHGHTALTLAEENRHPGIAALLRRM